MKQVDVDQFLRPPAVVLDQLTTWLKEEAISPATIQIYANWITFEASVSQAELTPQCLRQLYGLDSVTAAPDVRNQLGIAGFLDQSARHSDFQLFLEEYDPGQTDANFSVVSINNGVNDEHSSHNSVEASLDLQYSLSIAYHAMATFYSTGGRGPVVPDGGHPRAGNSTNEPYLEQLHYLASLPDENLPAVLTMSYGEPEQTVPAAYATAVCDLFAQLGARGVSIIFSSGDSGPGGNTCETNDGSARSKFLPEFPAGCPFITAVGGVQGLNPERGAGFSGGGFSDLFQRPTYQDHAVKEFLEQLGSQWQGLYNPKGRGIPDVSAQSNHFIVRDHGLYVQVGGTR
ncbi:tripeptidyl peptidase SED3 [Penicillium chermesinum]|uniref:tripeptidyl-peptidase II n=1 Tax=Penicillium chermesinum TaxID=63820 RepID=A0A9W9TG88_9EURO|nr:tripeptidyl peptidase SED3 [Penicillium chermesinum]KAJ5220340.1 tripeptidyl peptidase SED3 [Penicillium chermesinum]